MTASSAVTAEWLPVVRCDGDSSKAAQDAWRQHLIMNERGSPRAVLANAITALRSAPEWDGVLGFNEFSMSTIALNRPLWSNGTPGIEWRDHEDRLAADWLQHQGVYVSVDIAGLAVQTVARDRTFHPVRQKLDSLKWDGIRLGDWLCLYLGADTSDYTCAVGARWLISAVVGYISPESRQIAR